VDFIHRLSGWLYTIEQLGRGRKQAVRIDQDFRLAGIIGARQYWRCWQWIWGVGACGCDSGSGTPIPIPA